jgi:hypothetical protein
VKAYVAEVDSGSGVVWVADQGCRGCNVSDAKLFDPQTSKSIVDLDQTITVEYGIGMTQI